MENGFALLTGCLLEVMSGSELSEAWDMMR